ncbi:glycoside hydrolase family 99-like domain-containing protein [Jiangella endophytica]|uniref:glycoside hydrolase family 99-like domain-containing protein n=1 Tax=Jiangella endophytica TaxID=1623398 RepID=UPI000E354EDC|nr:glycoside hydrolase family 99-like domain-containing protein [Jiangella endophytica]
MAAPAALGAVVAPAAAAAPAGPHQRPLPRKAGGGTSPHGVSARYLIEDDFFFMEKSRYPLPDAWDIDQAGALISQQYGRWFRTADTSSRLPVLMMRPFQPQDGGVLWLEFRIEPISASLDGISFTLREQTEEVVSLRAVGNSLGLRRPNAADLPIATLAPDVEIGLRLKVDLDAGQVAVCVGGTLVAEQVPLLKAGATLDNLLVASSGSATNDMYFGPVRLYRDTIVNEQFVHVTPGQVPAGWAAAANGVTLSLIETLHSQWADRFCLRAEAGPSGGSISHPAVLSRGYDSTSPLGVSEFKVRIEQGTDVTYRIGLMGGQTLRVRLGATHIEVLDGDGSVLHQRTYRPALWNHVKVRVDVPESTVDVHVNGKRVLAGVPAFGSAASQINPPRSAALELGPGVRVQLDDVRVYWESHLPSDYVPAPVPASTGTTHHIGMSEFGGWRTGHHLGWDLITRFPERKPYLGWYDDGISEVADWENKWLAEAGITFRMQCWFRPSSGVGQPIKTPDLAHSLHDGYFESQYSDAVKFAVMWENVASGQTNSADFRQNIVPYLIEYYFRDPRYYVVDQKPVFCVYNSRTLLTNFGSATAAKAELDYLRAAVQELGFDDVIYLTIAVAPEAAAMGISGEYAYSYDGYPELQQASMEQRHTSSPVDVLATLSMGRDDLPWIRTMGRIMPPDDYRQVAEWARDQYLPSLPAGHLGRRITMLGNWNEWGEGHFLQPSDYHGFDYLNAIRDTFATGSAPNARPTPAQQRRLQKLYPYGRELPPASGSAPPADGDFTIGWDFTTDGDRQGWVNLANVQGLTASSGALRGTSSVHDPQVGSPAGLGIEAAEHPYLRIRMRTTPIQQGEVFFITEHDGVYSQSKGARFMAIPQDGQDYGEIDLDMWRVPTWRGRIHQIRIDPIVDVGEFAIDYVGLRHVPMTGPRLRLDGILESRPRPEVHDGIVYVSIEQVVHGTGGRAGISPDGDAVHIARGGDTVTVPTTGTTVRHNDADVTIEAPARMLADRTIGIPASFFADVLDFSVAWDGNTQELAIAGGPIVITVKADGSGDFTSPTQANASILDASAARPYVIEVHPGTYAEREWTVKPHVTVRGTDRDTCILRGDLPDDATDAQISGSSTLWLSGTATLENLTILAKNMRYAIHDEASGANVGAVHVVRNCRIEHAGNQAARDWRTAHPESGLAPATVWLWDRPYGYGSASGVQVRVEDSTLAGTREPFYVHTNKDFSTPNVTELVRCDLRLGHGAFATVVATQSLGSGTADVLTLTDCTWSPGYIDDTDTPWISQVPARQVSDHAEIHHTVDTSAPLGYLPRQRGSALRIFSLDTSAAASITVAGSAVPLIFGDLTAQPGGGGLSAYLYGSVDISGILVGLQANVTVANTLGRRLGDRRTAPVQLDVTAAGQTRTVVFGQDHTAQSNAGIIALINQAISGIAQAQEYLVAQNEYYPSFPDRELSRTASGPFAIARWSAVVANGTGLVNAAGATAQPAQIVGVALTRMTPGATGRVLTSGFLHRSQLAGLTGTTIPAGATIYLSDTASGQFSLTGTRALASAVAPEWVHFGT